MTEEEESSSLLVGAGGWSPTLLVPRHLPEPALDKLAEPATQETRLPAASAAVHIGQPCLDPHVQCSLSVCSGWELRYYGPTRGGVCPGSQLLRYGSLELGQEPSPALMCSSGAFKQLCSPSGPGATGKPSAGARLHAMCVLAVCCDIGGSDGCPRPPPPPLPLPEVLPHLPGSEEGCQCSPGLESCCAGRCPHCPGIWCLTLLSGQACPVQAPHPGPE